MSVKNIRELINVCGLNIEEPLHTEVLNVINKALDKYEQQEWIPCSERLPECEWGAETKALMYQRKCPEPSEDDIYTGYFGKGGLHRDAYFRTYADTTEGVDASDVIAWMPLPEPYKEGGAE